MGRKKKKTHGDEKTLDSWGDSDEEENEEDGEDNEGDSVGK